MALCGHSTETIRGNTVDQKYLKLLIADFFFSLPTGLEVMVKFRDKYDLQRLDPFKQSGGERSVSTALYMMAMQHMTQVPFRCVDEINQVCKLLNCSFSFVS